MKTIRRTKKMPKGAKRKMMRLYYFDIGVGTHCCRETKREAIAAAKLLGATSQIQSALVPIPAPKPKRKK